MKIGIIGPPQSGKTTMFRVLLQSDISGNIGVSKILDSRIGSIAESFSSKKRTYPEHMFVDLGNLSGYNKKNLSELHDIDLFVCVTGAFFSQKPEEDLRSCFTDMIISDIELVENRIERIKKEGAKGSSGRELEILEKCQSVLSEERFLRDSGITPDEIKLLSGLTLLTLKPLIAVVNVPDDISSDVKQKIESTRDYCLSKDLPFFKFFGKTEEELIALEEKEKKDFLEELGDDYNFREKLGRLINKSLNLITFFTAGDKEARGWFLKSGLPAVEAAGKIHSDIKRGFIRAETFHFEDLVKYGTLAKIREAGLLRLEGKEYIVKDGDVLTFRFNI